MTTFKELLSGDSEFKRYRHIVGTIKQSLILDAILDEAKFLHASRKARTLHAKKMSPDALRDAILQELSNRSRLVELRSLLSRQYELLGVANETIKKHLRVRYSEDLSERARTAAERTLIVDKVLAVPVRLKSEIAGVIEVIDSYIKDIDSASYALRNSVDLLKMILDRRGVENI